MGKKKYYCLRCGAELDFVPTEDGGFCSTECEDSWYQSGGITEDEAIDNQGDIDDDFEERSEGIERYGGGPLTGYF